MHKVSQIINRAVKGCHRVLEQSYCLLSKKGMMRLKTTLYRFYLSIRHALIKVIERLNVGRVPTYLIIGHDYDPLLPLLHAIDQRQYPPSLSVSSIKRANKRIVSIQGVTFVNLEKKKVLSLKKHLCFFKRAVKLLQRSKYRYQCQEVLILIDANHYMQLHIDEQLTYLENLKHQLDILSSAFKHLSHTFIVIDWDKIPGAELFTPLLIKTKKNTVIGINNTNPSHTTLSHLLNSFKVTLSERLNVTLSLLIRGSIKERIQLEHLLYPYYFTLFCEALCLGMREVFGGGEHSSEMAPEGIYLSERGDENPKTVSEYSLSYSIILLFIRKAKSLKLKKTQIRRQMIGGALVSLLSIAMLFLSVRFIKTYSVGKNLHQEMKRSSIMLSERSGKVSQSELAQTMRVYEHYTNTLHRLTWFEKVGIFTHSWFDTHFHHFLDKVLDDELSMPIQTTLEKALGLYAKRWSTLSVLKKKEVRLPYYQLFKLYLMMIKPDRLDYDFARKTLSSLHIKKNIHPLLEKDDVIAYVVKHRAHFRKIKPNTMLINQMRRDLYIKPLIYNEYALFKETMIARLGEQPIFEGFKEISVFEVLRIPLHLLREDGRVL